MTEGWRDCIQRDGKGLGAEGPAGTQGGKKADSTVEDGTLARLHCGKAAHALVKPGASAGSSH